MHQVIEQHLGENPRNGLRETFQSALAKLNSLQASLRSHTLFHPLENSDVFQLQSALKTIVQFCPWVKAAPYDYAYHLLKSRLEKHFDDPRNNPFTPSSLFASKSD
jgi:hypothetical protein